MACLLMDDWDSNQIKKPHCKLLSYQDSTEHIGVET